MTRKIDGRPVRVYISCPITGGERSHNFYQACRAQEILMRAGYAVLNPALSMLHPAAWQISHKAWIDNDLPWVEIADMIVRLPGASLGADMETQHAKARGIPVWHVTLGQLERTFNGDKNGEDIIRE